jgi:putative protease
VSTVTAVYREAVDAVADGSFSEELLPGWLERLSTVFNRGFWMGGYYLGEKLGEWTGFSGNRATETKHHIGRVNKWFSRIKVAELSLTAGALARGEDILITGPTTGALRCRVDELRLDGTPVETAPKGTVVSVPVPDKVRPNDKLYLIKSRRFGEDTHPVNSTD